MGESPSASVAAADNAESQSVIMAKSCFSPAECSRGSAVQRLGEVSAERDRQANNRCGGVLTLLCAGGADGGGDADGVGGAVLASSRQRSAAGPRCAARASVTNSARPSASMAVAAGHVGEEGAECCCGWRTCVAAADMMAKFCFSPAECSRGSAVQRLGEVSAERDRPANNRCGGVRTLSCAGGADGVGGAVLASSRQRSAAGPHCALLASVTNSARPSASMAVAAGRIGDASDVVR
jgi:hypothetical protein